MPQETKLGTNSPAVAAAAEAAHATLQGLVASREDEAAMADALEKAFDYRGDVTLTLAGGETVSGYIFDRRRESTLDRSVVRLLTPDSNDKRSVPFSAIARVEFTGKDAAHGKTFENWLKRYVEKKLKGETASIESESLE